MASHTVSASVIYFRVRDKWTLSFAWNPFIQRNIQAGIIIIKLLVKELGCQRESGERLRAWIFYNSDRWREWLSSAFYPWARERLLIDSPRAETPRGLWEPDVHPGGGGRQSVNKCCNVLSMKNELLSCNKTTFSWGVFCCARLCFPYGLQIYNLEHHKYTIA